MATTDQDLLREYVRSASELAFRKLVETHVGLVYSAARRQVLDPDSAQDIAQEVFTLLARKAATLAPETVLSGWLYRTTRHVASEWLRRERRRSRREGAAMESAQLTAHENWRAIEPLLDAAMASLRQADHDAVVLRFFENQSLKEVGQRLNISEDAAQKRLTRATAKLRQFFQRHGQSVTVSGLIGAVTAGAIESVPNALAGTIASTAISSAAAGGVTTGLVEPLTIMKTHLATAAISMAVMSVPLALQQRTVNRLHQQNLALEQQASQLLAGEQGTRAPATGDSEELLQLRQEHNELMRLRGAVGSLRQELAAAKAASPSLVPRAAGTSPEAEAAQLSKDTVDVMKNLGLAARIYSTDHEGVFPTNFTQLTQYLPDKLAGNLPLDAFEFMPQPRVISEREPQLILFRERTPRQLPDGRWNRAYTFADGSVEEQFSPDGNFTSYETAHLASGPNPFPNPSPAGPNMDSTHDMLMRRYGLKK
jgi:RNA polymerase sigma factor (sigma-70 family)